MIARHSSEGNLRQVLQRKLTRFFKKSKLFCIFPSILNVPMTGKTLIRGQPRTGAFLIITTMNFKSSKYSKLF